MISLSYSRISLADIAQKLQLDSPEDAEFIVAKVINTNQFHQQYFIVINEAILPKSIRIQLKSVCVLCIVD